MSTFEVSARLQVRDGKLDGFKQQAAEIMRQTKEKDTRTLRYDWFLSRDGTECEVREAYDDADGLIEHHHHIAEAKEKLFSEFADGHTMTIYGEPTPAFVELAEAMAGNITFKWYSFLQGLDSDVTVVEKVPAGAAMRTSNGRPTTSRLPLGRAAAPVVRPQMEFETLATEIQTGVQHRTRASSR